VERVLIRDEITDHERGLSGAARAAGVTEYSFFQNAGYRGMYNMDLAKLKDMKGLKDKSRTLLDFMGKRELVGNLFRIVETEAKLKQQKTRGQNPAEEVAESVGQRVRSMMIENTGTSPEFLRLQADVAKVRSGLKAAAREMGSLDKPGSKKRRRLPPHP
jgi:DNA-damage-inducible protein D